MRKYWEFFKASYQITFSYRAAILVRLIRDFIMIFFFVILWAALFRQQETFSGFTFKSIVTYYILVRLLNQLYSYEPAYLVSRDIRVGSLSNYLVKPLGYLKYLAFYVSGRRLARILLTLITVLLIFVFAPGYVAFSASTVNAVAFIVSVILSWFIIFQIAAGVGALSFWFSETGNVRQAFDSLAGILGGLWIPLEMFPNWMQRLLDYLPFKYLFSFPVAVYQGKVTGQHLLFSLSVELIWLVIFTILINYIFRKGVAKYESFGS